MANPIQNDTIQCPYCGEYIDIVVDLSMGDQQSYIEDCQVCCRPINLMISVNSQGEIQCQGLRDDE